MCDKTNSTNLLDRADYYYVCALITIIAVYSPIALEELISRLDRTQ